MWDVFNGGRDSCVGEADTQIINGRERQKEHDGGDGALTPVHVKRESLFNEMT